MNKQVSNIVHTGVVARIIRMERGVRDLGIALSGGLSRGMYTRESFFAGIGRGSVPKRRRHSI